MPQYSPKCMNLNQGGAVLTDYSLLWAVASVWAELMPNMKLVMTKAMMEKLAAERGGFGPAWEHLPPIVHDGAVEGHVQVWLDGVVIAQIYNVSEPMPEIIMPAGSKVH